MVVSFICKCCWLLGPQLFFYQYAVIAIAMVSSRLLSACHDCHCRCQIALVFQLHLEGGRHGDKDADRGRVVIVDVDNGMLGITNKHNEADRL